MNLMKLTSKRDIRMLHVSLLVAISLVVGLALITRQSLWMDEGSSAFKALMPTWKNWWWMTMRIGGSDTQMPVYMFLLWGWQKLGATSEFALRAVNLPWLVITVIALKRIRFWPVVCLTSPFVMYYVGELRPYAMQIAGGALAAAALASITSDDKDNDHAGLHASAGAGLLLACSSLTGAIWAAGLWLGVLIIRPRWLCQRDFWIKLSPWVVGAIIMASFYAYTLMHGYRASASEHGGVLSMLFGIYELIGLLGLGPGRNELRISPAALVSSVPVLVPAFACVFGAWLCGVRAWIGSTSSRNVFGVASAIMFPILVLGVVGLVMDFRVLGRHMSPVIPAVLLPIASSLTGIGPWKVWGRVLGCLAICFALVSTCCLRFLERHARDDYRQASKIAFEALGNGKSVWWLADMNATRYYAYREGGMPLVNAIQVLESEPPTSLMFADMVVINRPDLRFKNVNYQDELRRNSFIMELHFTGFEIWKAR